MQAKGNITATKKRAPVQNLSASKPHKIKKVDELLENDEEEEDVSGSSDLDNDEGDILSSSESDDEEGDGDDDAVEDDEDVRNGDQEVSDEDVEDHAEDNSDDADVSDEDAEDNTEEISGWADSMARILNSSKPKHKKVLILSRAKKDYEIKPTVQKKPTLEQLEVDGIQPTEETVKEESDTKDPNPTLCLKTQRKLELKQKRLEKEWENLRRKKSEDCDVQVERSLLKIATKGVVQLFNAVAFQQKTIKGKLRKVRHSEFKKDKVLSQTKEMFQSVLKNSSGTVSDDDVEIKEEIDESITGKPLKSGLRNKDRKKPAWQALQDDFMLDAKMKDWDKSSDSDNDEHM